MRLAWSPLRPWVALVRWCYPSAAAVIDELLAAGRGWRLHLALPAVARGHEQAEERHPTAGAVSAHRSAWRWREALVLTVAVGALLTAGAIASSVLMTGTFVIDSTPAPGAREEPSPYFAIASAALALTCALCAVEALALHVRTRRGVR